MLKKILFVILTIGLVGCTQNIRAKKFGGSATIQLEPNRKLVNVTFKGDNLWLLTRQARPEEIPETYSFKEDSSWGILEGTVIIKETK